MSSKNKWSMDACRCCRSFLLFFCFLFFAASCSPFLLLLVAPFQNKDIWNKDVLGRGYALTCENSCVFVCILFGCCTSTARQLFFFRYWAFLPIYKDVELYTWFIMMLMLWPLAVTLGVTHVGAYHRPPVSHFHSTPPVGGVEWKLKFCLFVCRPVIASIFPIYGLQIIPESCQTPHIIYRWIWCMSGGIRSMSGGVW